MAERKKPRVIRRIQGLTAQDRVKRLEAIADAAVSRGIPEEIRRTAKHLERAASGLPVNARGIVTDKAASIRLQISTGQGIQENQRKFAEGLRLKQQRGEFGKRAAGRLEAQLGLQTQPSVIPRALGGGQPLDLKDPRIAAPLEAFGEATTLGQRKTAGRQVKAGVGALQSGKGRGLGLKRAGLGGLAAGGLAMLLPALFGKKDKQMDPAIQMALAQQMAGGGQGTTGTLRDVARLLSIMKSIQSLAGIQGPQAQGRPRLI